MESNKMTQYAMNEREIDIKDLFWEMAYRWRLILICVILITLLCGAYGFWHITRQRNARHTQEQIDVDSIKSTLTEEESREIDRLILYDNLLQEKNNYYDNSILMHIDPYNIQTVVLEYCIDTQYEMNMSESVKADITPKLIAAYREYFMQDVYLEDITELLTQQIEKKYLSELISFQADDSGVFTLLIIGTNQEQADELADAVNLAVESCKIQQEQMIGPHNLIVLDRYETCMIDETLLTKQLECLQSINTIKNNQSTLISNLTPQQTIVYNDTCLEDEEVTTIESQDSIKKYILFGIVLGIFIPCLWTACKFIYGRFLHSTKEIQELYAVRCLGCIGYEHKRYELFSFVDHWFDVCRGHQINTRAEQIERCYLKVKMLCKQEAIDKLAIITSLSLHEKEKDCLSELLNQLKTAGISSRLYEKVLDNMESMEQIADQDHVLILEQIGNTSYKTLEEEIAVCMYHNTHILGTLMMGREL